ncbi:MAG: hypothetical protein RQ760_00340 [Sedimentisphaerales bacterium]|nr:hypothetical protein [Sedimentisphaerales bacterium]
MYELLIRIETLCMGAQPLTLLGIGAITTVVGLLLWLAGTYFSSIVIGILGSVVGSFCGLLVSQWLDQNTLLSMGIGAAVFCVAAVIFKNIIIIVLAIIVFALAAGTTYSSMILASPAQQQDARPNPALVSSFSQMDSKTRLSYVNQISDEDDGFFEKLKILLKDTLGAMNPHKWKLLLSIVLGGIGGLLLIWFIKRFVIALCCSGVGALLVLVGIESLLMTAGLQLCNVFQEHRLALTVTYFSMAGIGTVVQLILTRSPKSKEPEEAQNTKT